jgi:hypothetical protein
MIWVLIFNAALCGIIFLNQVNIMTQLENATALLLEAAAKTDAINVQLAKVGTEIETLKAAVATGGAGNTTPEFDAALSKVFASIDGLKATAQVVDEKNPDAPAPV